MVVRRWSRAHLAALGVTLMVATACSSPSGDGAADSSQSDSAQEDCVIAAAGDVAGEDDYRRGAERTAQLISAMQPKKVLALGDLAYSDGRITEFEDYYDPTWGAFKSTTAPTPGNHEYRTEGKGYYEYFDVAPNYSFDACGWHIVSVDQYAGLSKAAAFVEREGVAAGDAPLLVFWHEPRFSSGSEHGTNPDLQPLWAAAVTAGAEIVLNGHDHHYERFEPLDANGEPASGGTVQFVSGNGGHHPRDVGDREPYSAVTVDGEPGVLFLTLRADGYDWSYRDVEGRTGDSGSRELP